MFLGSSASKSGLLTKQVLLRTRKQKFLVYSAVTTSALLAYYTYGLDNKQRRKVKVYTSGVARFARMIKLGVVVVSDFKIRCSLSSLSISVSFTSLVVLILSLFLPDRFISEDDNGLK